VLVDDGGMIVLGGLIQDNLTESEQRVPLLGSIPLLGNLFKVRSTRLQKTNLMVFIRPRVIRNAEQAAMETNAKYNFMRGLQQERNDGRVKLIPGARQPTLPLLEGPAAPAQPVPGLNAAEPAEKGN